MLELQELGMMDITRSHKAVDERSEALDILKRYDNAAKFVGSVLEEIEEKASKKQKLIQIRLS